MGDVPIYVAPGSADQRAWPELFRDDAVAGVPPDAYADDGPAVGQPALRLAGAAARSGYRWWIERFRRTFELFDLVRVDHFRGFVAYWAVPAGRRDGRSTATGAAGPAAAVFDAARGRARRAAGRRRGPRRHHPAGDARCAGRSASPAWRSCSSRSTRRPRRARTSPPTTSAHQVVYTGTHDNDTVAGWWATLPEERRAVARRRSASATADEASPLVDDPAGALLAARAGDDAGAGRARPGLRGAHERAGDEGPAPGSGGMEPGALTAEHAARLRELTAAAGRLA